MCLKLDGNKKVLIYKIYIMSIHINLPHKQDPNPMLTLTRYLTVANPSQSSCLS